MDTIDIILVSPLSSYWLVETADYLRTLPPEARAVALEDAASRSDRDPVDLAADVRTLQRMLETD